jgi:chromosome segregation ATPase
MTNEQQKKKKKGLIRKIASKFKKDSAPDDMELVKGTIGDLEEVVVVMSDILDSFDTDFENEVEGKRNVIDKVWVKLPKFMQSRHLKDQTRDKEKISKGKKQLGTVKSSISNMMMVIEQSPDSFEKVAEAYIEVVSPEGITDEKAEEIEEKINLMQLEFVQYMEEMQRQLLLLRTTIDHMAQDLGDHGVKLDNITDKVEEVSTKLDTVQEKLVEISRKLTKNRLLMFGLATGVTIVLLSFLIK